MVKLVQILSEFPSLILENYLSSMYQILFLLES